MLRPYRYGSTDVVPDVYCLSAELYYARPLFDVLIHTFRFTVRREVWLVAEPAVPTGPMHARDLYRRFCFSIGPCTYLLNSISGHRCTVCRIINCPTVLPPCGISATVCCMGLSIKHLSCIRTSHRRYCPVIAIRSMFRTLIRTLFGSWLGVRNDS